jgi:hypothetical protein
MYAESFPATVTPVYIYFSMSEIRFHTKNKNTGILNTKIYSFYILIVIFLDSRLEERIL